MHLNVHRTSDPNVWFLLLQTSVIYVFNYLQLFLCCSFPGYLVIGRANRRKCIAFLIIASVLKISYIQFATRILSLKVAKIYIVYISSLLRITHISLTCS